MAGASYFCALRNPILSIMFWMRWEVRRIVLWTDGSSSLERAIILEYKCQWAAVFTFSKFKEPAPSINPARVQSQIHSSSFPAPRISTFPLSNQATAAISLLQPVRISITTRIRIFSSSNKGFHYLTVSFTSTCDDCRTLTSSQTQSSNGLHTLSPERTESLRQTSHEWLLDMLPVQCRKHVRILQHLSPMQPWLLWFLHKQVGVLNNWQVPFLNDDGWPFSTALRRWNLARRVRKGGGGAVC